MKTLFKLSLDPSPDHLDIIQEFPVSMAKGPDVGKQITIGLVNNAIRDERILQIVMDSAAVLVANASNCDQMLQIFLQQVEKNRQLAAKMAKEAQISQ